MLSTVINANQVEWRSDAPGLVRGRPVRCGDRVVLNSGPVVCAVRGLDSEGQTVWTSDKATSTNDVPIADDRGRVFVATNDGGLACLRGEDGGELWELDDYEVYKRASRELRGDSWDFTGLQGRPALSPDQRTVYATSWEGVLVAADTDSGALKWSLSRDRYTNHGSPAVAPDGAVYYTDDGNFLVKSKADGTFAWERQLEERIGEPSVDCHGRPVVGDRNGLIQVLDPDSGETVRSFSADGPVYRTPVSDAVTGRMFVASSKGTVYCLEPYGQDGFREVWSQPHGDQVSDLTLDTDGRVCVVSAEKLTIYEPDGTLYGLIQDAGRVSTVTPAGDGRYMLGGETVVGVRPTLAALADNLAAASQPLPVPEVKVTADTVEIGDFLLFIQN